MQLRMGEAAGKMDGVTLRFNMHALFATFLCVLLLSWAIHSEGLEGVVKSIETEDGDVYDCVDFYKQPAFSHPLLQNHTFHPEMRPTSRPKRILAADNSSSSTISEISTKFKDTCPPGTVPILRGDNKVGPETEFLRQRYSQLGVKRNGANEAVSRPYFAVAQSKNNPTKVYNGIGARLAIFNPSVKPSQYSSGELIIKGGSDSITAGWTVNPGLFKDNQTRFFVYTVTGDSHCVNSECGFISVRSGYGMGAPIKPVSRLEGPIYDLDVFIYQDAKNGNWWLQIGREGMVLGFWPQNIFKGLYNSATYVACGGEAYGPAVDGHPEMGTGYFPFSREKKYNAYCDLIDIVDQSHLVVAANDLEQSSSDEDFYAIAQPFGRVYIFGGPKSYE